MWSALWHSPATSQPPCTPQSHTQQRALLQSTHLCLCPPPPSLQDEDIAHFFSRVEACRSLWAALQAAAREAAPQGVQVVYTVIQSLTADGRDRGLDYKLSGFHVPPGSWDAEVGCT